MSIESIRQWHKLARPVPTNRDFDVQLGCHLEEIAEMIDTLEFSRTYNPHTVHGRGTDLYIQLVKWADALKDGGYFAHINDRKEFLDSIADQVVTAVGAAYCANMDPEAGVREVNTSNWTKVDINTENFIRDDNGKIMKPPGYKSPNLEGLY